MSHLLARIMLALLMLPLAAVVYVITIAIFFEVRSSEELGFLTADALGAAFVAVYWLLLWRREVRWTPVRIHGTWIAAIIALMPAALVGAIGSAAIEDAFGIFLGGVILVLVWLAATTLLWRESPRERARRVAGRGAGAIVCPVCGYNLTGLDRAACPECGGAFTLEDLFSAQPSQAQQQLERSE